MSKNISEVSVSQNTKKTWIFTEDNLSRQCKKMLTFLETFEMQFSLKKSEYFWKDFCKTMDSVSKNIFIFVDD